MKKENFRKSQTSSGMIILAGKNAENNELLVNQAGKNEYVLHTETPGSPFVNIKEDVKKVSKEDLYESAVFCAKYSQAWKKSKVKTDVEVHYFLGKDIFKEDCMKTGTFGVRKFKTLIAKKEDIEKV
jgi:predicted ribosome quality control (RQC) complex YloA/Tae2 family protein